MKIVSLLTVTILILGFAIESRASGQQAEAADTVCVRGKGVGDTKEAALMNAYCNAVETAVGMFVDAEQMVDNDQLVQDKILTHSNAYIERYEEKKSVKHDGVVEVVIVAWVRRAELTRKLRDVMPAVTLNVSSVSQNLYAEIVTKDRRDGDAEALLKDVFDNFDPLSQLMKVSVSNPKPDVAQSKESDDAKLFSYRLKFEIDQDNYFKVWAPRINKILSQVSLNQGKSFSFKRVVSLSGIWKDKASQAYSTRDRTSYFAYDKMYFMCANLLGSERFLWGEECDLNRDHVYDGVKMAMACNDGPYKDSWFEVNRLIRRWGTVPQMKAKSKMYVAVVNRVNRNGCAGTFYELSGRSASVISAWMMGYSGLSDERRTWTSGSENARRTRYRLSLKDASGDELANGDCLAFNHDMSNVGCVCWGEDKYDYHRDKPGNTIPYVIYITPWVGCFAGECSTWVDVEVGLDDIPKISTMSVSSESEAGKRRKQE